MRYMAISDRNNEQAAFVRRVVISSVVILILLGNLLGFAMLRADDLRGVAAEYFADSGRYETALDMVDGIGDEIKRLDSKYDVADIMLKHGEFGSAADLFASLGDYRDSADRCLECSYSYAEALFENGKYDEALGAFSVLGDYSDAKIRRIQVIYRQAEIAAGNDDHAEAIMLFLSLGDYNDAPQRAYDVALAVTGDSVAAQNMLASGGLTAEELERSVQIAERRALLPLNSVAAGNYHTVILRSDGTVFACGDNSFGQCDVSGWSDVVQVFAGARHTVGLKNNGTVVAVGDNSMGQCDVSGWFGVARLAVNDYSTIAVMNDGSVKICGEGGYDTIEHLYDAEEIFAGGYSAVALTENRTYISSHKSCSLKPQRSVVAITMNTGYAVALQCDGTCVSNLEEPAGWTDMVWVDAGANGIIGVDLNGKIRSFFFRETSAVPLPLEGEFVQCAAGTSHYVFVTADGEVVACGDNSFGQCNI